MKEYKARDVLKKFLKQQNETLVHVVAIMNERHPEDKANAQNLTNKLSRNTIRFSEVMEIADILGFEIGFQKIGTQPEPEKPIQEQDKPKKKSGLKTESATAIADRVNTRFYIVSGNYFKEILIIGKNSKEAAINFNIAIGLKETKSKTSGIAFEIMLCQQLEKEYGVIVYPCEFADNIVLDETEID